MRLKKKNTMVHTFIRKILEWSGLKRHEVSFLQNNISFRRAPWIAIGGAIAAAGAVGGGIAVVGIIAILLA